MRKSVLLILVPVAVLIIMLTGEAKSEVRESIAEAEKAGKLSPEDMAELERALDPNSQTPAEDRHLVLRKLIKLGALGAILATPALAASLIPLKLIGLLLLLKKLPPVNIIPLPPPPPPVYYEPPYQPQYSPPQYDAQPPAYNPPAYNPPQAPPAYNPPAYNPPMAPPAYNPPQAPPAYRK